MKLIIKNIFIIILIYFDVLFANPILVHFINELKFDSETWFLELHSNRTAWTQEINLDGCYLTSISDMSFFKNGMKLDSNYLVITEKNLQTPFKINPVGDVIRLFLADKSELDWLQFGNSNSPAFGGPPAPVSGQSVSIIDDCYYLDNTPTLGKANDTLNATGYVNCKVTDRSGNALPAVRVFCEPLHTDFQKYGKYTITDKNGYFFVNILAAWVNFYLTKDDYQSTSINMQVYPESLITTHVSLDAIQSVHDINAPALTLDYRLNYNYPNPFNNITNFIYKTPIDDYIEIYIINTKGQQVKNLYSGFQRAGEYKISWNSLNTPSGIYICQLKSANITLSKKCLLVK